MQRFQPAGRRLGQQRVGLFVFARQLAPAAVQRIQRFLQRCGRALAQRQEGGGLQRRAVHEARALDQVVRLVDQQAHAPAVGFGECVPGRAVVEVVVEVAHQHIAPAHHFLAQVVGADGVGQRGVAQRGLVHPQHGGGGRARLGQPVVKALGQRAGRAVAGLVGVFTGLVARHAFEHAQLARGVQAPQGIERELATGCLGGQVQDLVQALRGRRLERTKQRGHGLADAGRRLRHQHAFVGLLAPLGAVHRFGQPALAGPEIGKRKGQRAQGRVARASVCGLRACPAQVALAQRVELRLQVAGALRFGEQRFFTGVDVEVDQRHADLVQTQLLAQHPAVHPRLRPVQGALVGRDQRRVAPVGFDLFHPHAQPGRSRRPGHSPSAPRSARSATARAGSPARGARSRCHDRPRLRCRWATG